MTAIVNVPKWGPRLARLYSKDVERLEAFHAGRLSPGTATWEQAVEALYDRMVAAGPVKGAKLVRKAHDYLRSIDRDERAYIVLAVGGRSRNAYLMFATFSIGNHPDPAVEEEGLKIVLHIVRCSRNGHSRAVGIPVAYVSKHAIGRLYERGCDITENIHATSAFAFIAVLGYLTHGSKKHVDGGLSLLFSKTLLVGSLHRFDEETFLDVRTVLPVDDIGPGRQSLIDQATAATSVVLEWFANAEDLDERELAERIPFLPRRQDSWPMRAARGIEQRI